MSSENDSALGFDRFDPDAHPDGSIDVLGSIRNLNTAGENSHATRGEISNLLNDADRDYQWIRYRCNSMADAGVLEINHVQGHDRVEKRHSVTDEYLDDARKIARTMSIAGGEIPQDIGVDEFVDVAGELADALERIDENEDRIDELAARVEESADGASTGGEPTDGSSAAGDDDPHDGDPHEGVGMSKEEAHREEEILRDRRDDDPYSLTDLK